jgi:hypothetical protein
LRALSREIFFAIHRRADNARQSSRADHNSLIDFVSARPLS